ncbi:hypothetical protein [Petroclostridium sp. X23]|uniref:hypothetical protein n=1 Tax=Petroclostridium sp. X23 TaxID=3045146 RepID=UPI0024AE07D0|nr:hypothetical protein [Petroclostridium sp. X23]WHH58301.1 hypothetical protein QKW49_21255 [Petroclostridium sp. X23]
MGKDGKTKLRKPDIHKVDLVDDGANPGARIMLFKSKSAPEESDTEGGATEFGLLKNLMVMIGKALGWDQEQIEKAAALTEEGTEVIKPKDNESEEDVIKGNKEGESMGFDVTKLSPEAQAYIASLEKRATDAEAAQAAAETAKQTAEVELQKMKDEHPTEDDIFKGMSPAARKMMEDMQKRLDASEAAEYVTKAKDFEPLGVKADEFGPVLKAIAKACPEQYAKVEEALKSAAAMTKTGEVFKEYGGAGSGGAGGTAVEKINKRVEEIAKRDGISVHKAWEKIETEDPALLAEYRKEMR